MPIRYPGTRFVQEEEVEISKTNNYLSGANPDADPATIPDNGLSLIKNMAYDAGKLHTRLGLTEYALALPNTNPILGIYATEHTTYGLILIRATSDLLSKYTSTGWVELAPSGVPRTTGSERDFFNFVTTDNRCFFANNGVDPIREIDLASNTYIQLGNAPAYKYLAASANRLVGASLVGNEIQVGWSAFNNFSEWDATVNYSAGFTLFTDSPSDTNDYPTGIFNFGSYIIIPRQRSLWSGVRQPSASNPFGFKAEVTTIGADVPRAIKLTDFGLAFFNFQYSSVYIWNVGSDPIDISGPIRRSLKEIAIDPELIWIAYNQTAKRLSIFCASTSDITKAYHYSFLEKCWAYEEYNLPGATNIWESEDLDITASTLSIDELSGTMNSLAGTINSLGGAVRNTTRYFGATTGEIYSQQNFAGLTTEDVSSYKTDDGSAVNVELRSKTIVLPINDVLSNLVHVDVTPFTTGTINLEVSKNEGTTWSLSRSVVIGASDLKQRKILKIKRGMKAENLIFRLTSTDCIFILNGHSVKAMQAGISK